MQSRPALRLLALCALLASTLGSRPAAAVDYSPPPPLEVVHPSPVLTLDDYALMDAIVREHADRLAAETAARLEAERLAAELDHLWALWILDVYDRVGARTGVWLPWPTVALIIDASARHGVDPYRVGTIGACESAGRADAYNRSGASGFGQHLIRYWWARAEAAGLPGASPFDLAANIEVTAWYLARAGTSPWLESSYCWR